MVLARSLRASWSSPLAARAWARRFQPSARVGSQTMELLKSSIAFEINIERWILPCQYYHRVRELFLDRDMQQQVLGFVAIIC
jgi:hypothetical protein